MAVNCNPIANQWMETNKCDAEEEGAADHLDI